jgi:CSLREA domain-containing protein
MPSRFKFIATFFIIVTWVLTFLGPVGVTPVYAAGLVVNGNADTVANDGVCTLREAIVNANNDNQSGSTDCAAGSGADTITFAGNYTITLASALPDLTSSMTIDGSGHSVTVSGNNAVRVFAITAGTTTINRLNIISGTTTGAGGGIINYWNLTINNSTVSGSSAPTGGGIYNQGTLIVSNSAISGNTATGAGSRGGGIYNTKTLLVSGSTISSNSATDSGGGICNTSTGAVSVSNNSVISSNSAADVGGGIVNFNGGTVTVSDSTFSGNSAANSGGGIFNQGTLTVNNSTFNGNLTTEQFSGGGGIYNNATGSVNNSTFSGNSSRNGGGIRNTGTLTVDNSTFSGNSASNNGGIYNWYSSTLHLRNSLIANSPAGGDCGNSGTIATNINNLIEDGSCFPALSGDPLLGPLGNYGGSTQTFALLPGSPAINAGDSATCLATDQRGMARPQGAGCDIGAYEAKEQLGPNFVVNVSDDSDDGACDLFDVGLDCTLREAINAANSQAGANTITFAGNYTITLASALPLLADTLTLDGSGRSVTVSGNHAVRVFYIQSGAVVTMSQLSIINGTTNTYGGGIFNDHGMVAVSHSTVSGNSAANGGGGIDNYGGTLAISDSTVSGNATLGGVGGGINNSQGALTVSNSTFSSNSAGNGGIGGGIHNTSGTATVSNSTFSGNSASQYGGGIVNSGGTLTVTHGTLSGNSAGNGGGIYNNSTLHLRNSLIANSSGGGDCRNYGTLATNANNLIEDGTCSPALSGDPLLSSLGDYGGSTQTFALLPGSRAINAGDNATCLTPDQRSVARPQGSACDIGAFESLGFTLTKIGGDNQSTLVQTAFTNPLVISVTSATGEPVNGGQVILTAPASGASLTTTPITLTIANGTVSSTVTANGTAGAYSVVASAAGAANVAFSLTNNLAGTTTSLTSTSNPSTYGQAITFTATVTTSAVGLGTPIGSITFTIDSLSVNVPLDANGQAVYVTTTLSAGHHPITATYSGDVNHHGSTSNMLDQVVSKANSTTAIMSLLNPSTYGQSVTFTATVTSAVGTPSGSVQFYADGVALGSAIALSNGQASLSTAALAVGTHPITATYSGDANHNSSTSNTVDQVVNQADTAATLTSALNPSIVGQAVTFTATVASTVDTPSGSVQFYADGAALGSPVALSNGQASLSTSTLAVGTHAITATYSGDANYHGGVSNQVEQVVNHAKIYLPFISRNFVNASDVIVPSLTANANNLQVVVKNQGTALVVDESGVKMYLNPRWAMLGRIRG